MEGQYSLMSVIPDPFYDQDLIPHNHKKKKKFQYSSAMVQTMKLVDTILNNRWNHKNSRIRFFPSSDRGSTRPRFLAGTMTLLGALLLEHCRMLTSDRKDFAKILKSENQDIQLPGDTMHFTCTVGALFADNDEMYVESADCSPTRANNRVKELIIFIS